MLLSVDTAKCCCANGQCDEGKRSAVCVEVCPVQALSCEKILIIDKDKCILCGACIAMCDNDALTIS